MSTYKAKQMFEDGLKYVSAKKDPAMHDLLAGLLQLTEGLESEIQQLRQEIVNLSQQIGPR